MSEEKRPCRAITASGQRCSAGAEEGQDWCYNHSPERAEERRRNASAGGKARSRRPPDELETIKGQVRTIAAGVLQGEMDRGVAVVLNQLFNTMLRTVELQRRLDRQAELEDRITVLEDELARRRGGTGWGSSRIG